MPGLHLPLEFDKIQDFMFCVKLYFCAWCSVLSLSKKGVFLFLSSSVGCPFPLNLIFSQSLSSFAGNLSWQVVFHGRFLPLKVVFYRRLSSINKRLWYPFEDDYHHVHHTFHQHVRKYKLMEELKKWMFPWSGRRWVVKAQFHKIRWIINVIWIYKSTMIRNYNKLISITITIIVKTPTQPNLT